jgi:periplasmic divalent cation tolerance protein
MHPSAIQVVTTVAEQKDAEAIASAVLEKRLAACVQVSGPIDSRYWWNGRIERASEWIVTMKTRPEAYAALEQAVLGVHPYDQPEVVATPIVGISPGYLKWLGEQVRIEAAHVDPTSTEAAPKSEVSKSSGSKRSRGT